MTGLVPPGIEPAKLDALLDALTACVEAPDAAARAALAPILGEMQPLAGRRWTEFSPRGVVALVLWAGGRRERALALAGRALSERPADEVARIVIDNGRSAAMQDALDAVHAKRMDIARARLAAATDSFGRFGPLADEQALAALLDYVEDAKARRERPPACSGRPTVIHVGAWGERFVRAAARSVLASCLADGNVPRLARHGTVILHLHMRAEDIGSFRALPVVRELERHARVELTAIPDHLFAVNHMWGRSAWSRLLLAAVEYDSLMLARAMGADMMELAADLILSQACLGEAKARLVAGFDVVAAAALRVTAAPFLKALEEGGYRRGAVVDVPAEALYRMSLATLHPFIAATFMRATPQPLPAAAHQFYFVTPEGFAARSYQLHGFAFSTRTLPPDFTCDLHTLDCRMAAEVLTGRDPASACFIHRDPPGDMYYVGLDEGTGVAEFGQFEASPRGVSRGALYFVERPEDLAFLRWMLDQRVLYRVPPDVPVRLPADPVDETEAMAAIAGLMEAGRPAALERLKRYGR